MFSQIPNRFRPTTLIPALISRVSPEAQVHILNVAVPVTSPEVHPSLISLIAPVKGPEVHPSLVSLIAPAIGLLGI